jgi:hypothetical protein
MSTTSSYSSSKTPTIDNEKLHQFMGKVLSDFGGAASAVLVYIGDKLGLYKACLCRYHLCQSILFLVVVVGFSRH